MLLCLRLRRRQGAQTVRSKLACYAFYGTHVLYGAFVKRFVVFAVLSELIVFAFDFVITTTPEKLFRVVGKKKNPATNVTGLRTKIKQTNRLFCRIFSYPDYNRRCLNFTDSAGFHLFVDFNHRWRISLRPEDNC